MNTLLYGILQVWWFFILKIKKDLIHLRALWKYFSMIFLFWIKICRPMNLLELHNERSNFLQNLFATHPQDFNFKKMNFFEDLWTKNSKSNSYFIPIFTLIRFAYLGYIMELLWSFDSDCSVFKICRDRLWQHLQVGWRTNLLPIYKWSFNRWWIYVGWLTSSKEAQLSTRLRHFCLNRQNRSKNMQIFFFFFCARKCKK